MNIDLILFRQISVLSLFFGGLCGLITLIPFLGTFSLTFLVCFIAPLVIWLLIKYNCLSLESVKQSVIVGAIAGFVSFLGFSVIYIPITVVLMKFFSITSNYMVGVMLSNANFFILVVLSLFMGVLGAVVNAFTGFLTFAVIDILSNLSKR